MKIDHVIAAAVVLSALVIVFLFFMPPMEEVIPEPEPICENGETKTCFAGNCRGEQVCISGRWSACRLHMICIPGSKAPCIEFGCVSGYKTCNECGTGYGECE